MSGPLRRSPLCILDRDFFIPSFLPRAFQYWRIPCLAQRRVTQKSAVSSDGVSSPIGTLSGFLVGFFFLFKKKTSTSDMRRKGIQKFGWEGGQQNKKGMEYPKFSFGERTCHWKMRREKEPTPFPIFPHSGILSTPPERRLLRVGGTGVLSLGDRQERLDLPMISEETFSPSSDRFFFLFVFFSPPSPQPTFF